MSLTLREISETPQALKQTAAYLEREWPAIDRFFRRQTRLVFLGCGSSYSLARSMSLMTQMHLGLTSAALAAGDLLLHARRYAALLTDAAVICISRSGQTSEMLLALDAAKPFNVTPAALVCADGTPLEVRSALTLRMPWAFDNSVCQTRSVSNFYFAMAYILARLTGSQALLADLLHIAENGQAFLEEAGRFAAGVAAQPWTNCIVLADAELEGIADEGALAFKEICQLPSNSYHFLDIRHGPMVLVNEHTLLIAAPGAGDPLETNLLTEMGRKRAHVISVTDTPLESPGVVNLCYGRELTHIARGLPLIMLCQLLSFYKAAHTGADPDRPTGLDAWISLDKEEDGA